MKVNQFPTLKPGQKLQSFGTIYIFKGMTEDGQVKLETSQGKDMTISPSAGIAKSASLVKEGLPC